MELVNLNTDDETTELESKIKTWILVSPGEFSSRDVITHFALKDPEDKMQAIVALENLYCAGLIERVGSRKGIFRPKNDTLNRMDFSRASETPSEIWLPFGLSDLVEIMPGNIIIIAGEPNAGKTAFLLNIIKGNRKKFNVHYFNSEMGSQELKKRLKKFDDVHINDWNFTAYERDGDFADVMFTGPENINIIDFLEVHDEFYKIGQYIKEVHHNLKGAIAVIAIQKNPGLDDPIGGKRAMEKARLAIAMSPGVAKITKAKNFRTDFNPNGCELEYTLYQGCRFNAVTEWAKPEPIKRRKKEAKMRHVTIDGIGK